MGEDNVIGYVIEHNILFTPNQNQLEHLSEHYTIKLPPATSMCLLILLQNRGNILTQNEIMAFAWGEGHRQVSFNRFYQSILTLRKTFVKMGITQPLIITLPRKGVKISPDVTVTISENKSVLINKDVVDENQRGEGGPDKIQSPSRLLLPDIICIIVTIILSLSVILFFRGNNEYFKNYHLAGTLKNQCSYYFNGDTTDFTRHTAFMNKHQELCQPRNNLYLTAYYNTKNISVLICSDDVKISTENHCMTVFYPSYEK